MTTKQKTETFTTSDGVGLHVYTWLPAGRPRGIVQIVHGLTEHAGRYARFQVAKVFNASDKGWAGIGHDHNRHGETPKLPQNEGNFVDKNRWHLVLDDVKAVTRDRWPGCKMV